PSCLPVTIGLLFGVTYLSDMKQYVSRVTGRKCKPYSTFAPDSRITRSHIGASARISAAKASGEAEGEASMPWDEILSRISGLARPFAAAACTLRTISIGVPAGAYR